MNTTENRHSPIRRQLDAYAESWKSDHLAAQECFDVEERIAIGLSLASALDTLEAGWRRRVFTATWPPSDTDDEVFHTCLNLWLTVSDVIVSRAADLEQRFGTVSGASELRAATEKARTHLATWSAPTPAIAVGLRDQSLTPSEANELDTLLGNTAPPLPARQFEVKGSSFLS